MWRLQLQSILFWNKIWSRHCRPRCPCKMGDSAFEMSKRSLMQSSLSKPVWSLIKIKVPRLQLVPYKPQSCSSTSANSATHMNLYRPGITVFIGFLLFVPNPGWHLNDGKLKVTLYLLYWTQHIVIYLFVKENLENFNRPLGSLYFEPPPFLNTPLPFRPNVELVQAVLSIHLLLPAWLWQLVI